MLFSSSDGSLTPCFVGDVDYVSLTALPLVYRGGSNQDDLLTITIEILEDSIEDPREKFQVVFKATKNVYFPFPVITVIICDNDGGNP